MGRPPADPCTVRSKRLVTFVTPVEMEALRAMSVIENLSLSALCHRLLAEALEIQRNNRDKA